MSWRSLFASSQLPEHRSPQTSANSCADSADIAGPPIAQSVDQEGGFADFADFALDIKKDTLSLTEETPVKYHSEKKPSALSPSVPLCASHNSRSTAEYAKSAKPLQLGWLVVYQDKTGRLRGGADERPAGTVKDCDARRVTLSNGDDLPLSRIIAVARTSRTGAVLAAWLVARHGLDGSRGTAA
ncbi:MAG: hypothetical protein JSS38_01540 [Nitrospira sp.]|nr:hypothetical protein [Nitrospira sp.]